MHNKYKQELSSIKNPTRMKGSLEGAIVRADVFIGVSGKLNILDRRMVTTMNNVPIIFPLSNPEPEIHPFASTR
jgi:malate dehydrogenase (oxaloacetate-decarboxylating)